MKHICIIGAGVLGRILAIELLQQNISVTIFDPRFETGLGSTSYVAGGMLAPFSERQTCDDTVFNLGLQSMSLWPDLAKRLQLGRLLPDQRKSNRFSQTRPSFME